MLSTDFDYQWTRDTRKQAMCWCFTVQNWTEQDLLDLEAFYDGGNVKYLVLGKEVAPTTGTPHLQCFVIMASKKRANQMDAYVPRGHNMRPMYAKSNPLACATYCKKDKDFREFGDPPKPLGVPGRQRQLHDYEEARTLAKQGKLDEIDASLSVRYYGNFKKIAQDNPPKLKDLKGVCGYWFQGDPSSGKSYAARNRWPGGFYDKLPNKWWDGYKGEPTVVIDDLEPQHEWMGHHLKRIADQYVIPVEIKGTSTVIRPKRVVVTSNYSISEIFGKDFMIKKALIERFKVEVFTAHYERKHVDDLSSSSDEEGTQEDDPLVINDSQ